jgi:hypothetical protein
MNSRLKSEKLCDTEACAFYGALLGALLGLMEQFCHAFCPASWTSRHTPGGSLFAHVFIEVAIGAFAGAALFTGISAVRNWLIRDK